MKNKEKYAKEIVDVACSGDSIAVTKGSEHIVRCSDIACSECLFACLNCAEEVKEWAEQEYIEKPVISKSDRAFLEYLKCYKYIARDDGGELYIYMSIPTKRSDCWGADGAYRSLRGLDIDFPMVKWSDEEPWLIKDLKKLEVVDEYEK